MCVIACHSPCIVEPLTDDHTKSITFYGSQEPFVSSRIWASPEFSLQNSWEEIIKLIDSEGEMDFENYPDSAEFILNFREKINAMIKFVAGPAMDT